MSESRNSDKSGYKFVIPFMIMLTGLVLLWLGNQELQQFQAEVESYVPARPDNRTVWLLIFGTAASIAGAVGLIRKRDLF